MSYSDQPFRISVPIPATAISISYESHMMSLGSCFSENIGRKFIERKFKMLANPFGQLYNPLSMAQSMRKLMSTEVYTESDLIFADGLYHSFDHHSDYSSPLAEDCLRKINQELVLAREHLKKAEILFLTFGSAYVFELGSSGRLVSNCHKMPASAFRGRMLTVDEIVGQWSTVIESLRGSNAGLKIILSVSPVRYFAYGHFENSVSKGILFSAIHSLKKVYPDLYYFPAYELVMDELRDYRFYGDDMLHPNHLAIQYVWEKLTERLLSEESKRKMEKVEDIFRALTHRVRNPQTEAHARFVERYVSEMEKLTDLNFESEKNQLRLSVQRRSEIS